MTKAFDKIMAGLEDAIAYAKGDTSRCVTHTFVDGKRVLTEKPPHGSTRVSPDGADDGHARSEPFNASDAFGVRLGSDAERSDAAD